MTHEKTCITGSHLRTHGDSADLLKNLSIKLKSVQSENKLSQANKCCGWWVGRISGTTIQKECKGFESVSVGYGCVQGHNIQREQQLGLKTGMAVEMFKKVEGMCCVFDVRWQ